MPSFFLGVPKFKFDRLMELSNVIHKGDWTATGFNMSKLIQPTTTSWG
jgi:hypothetical protein